MLKDNLVMLRKLHGYSQEEVAEKIDISRQAYAYLKRFKGLDYLYKHYNVLHTFSFEG